MNERGVTLIELVVVTVIIAIGATLMAPAIGRWTPNFRLGSASRELVSTMRTAQVKAVSSNMRYQVSFNNPGSGSYVLQRNTGGLWVNDGSAQTFPSGIGIKSTTFLVDGDGRPYVRFNVDFTSSAGGITLQNPKKATKVISVTTSTGKISVR